MELVFNIINLKSAITFLHLSGLIFGVGGAWILDGFLLAHLNDPLSKERYRTIEFISKNVIAGLIILWISGFAFIAYYYLFSPEFLYNQKVWAKIFIVSVLTINGVLVHNIILPYLKKSIGSTLVDLLSNYEIRVMASIGVMSFISWLFPIILGVTKTLNFTVSALQISFFYLLLSAVSLLFVNASIVYFKNQILEKNKQSQTTVAKQRKGYRAGLGVYMGNIHINTTRPTPARHS